MPPSKEMHRYQLIVVHIRANAQDREARVTPAAKIEVLQTPSPVDFLQRRADRMGGRRQSRRHSPLQTALLSRRQTARATPWNCSSHKYKERKRSNPLLLIGCEGLIKPLPCAGQPFKIG